MLPGRDEGGRERMHISEGFLPIGHALAWSPDDQHLAMGTETGGVVLFDAPSSASPTAA